MDIAALTEFTDTIDTYMYTYFLVFLLIAAGIYFTVRTKGVQFRYIKDMFRSITEKKHVEGRKSVSSFQAMMVSTASRVGTGNIAGVATAIAVGGPGAVFWMWVMALINGASAFVESTLAQIWKVRAGNGEFRGGPAYYIQKGLGKRWLGIVFAVALILRFGLGFNSLQTYNSLPPSSTSTTRPSPARKARRASSRRRSRSPSACFWPSCSPSRSSAAHTASASSPRCSCRSWPSSTCCWPS